MSKHWGNSDFLCNCNYYSKNLLKITKKLHLAINKYNLLVEHFAIVNDKEQVEE
jgi:hypothetical protein